jgi:hypothetical protein
VGLGVGDGLFDLTVGVGTTLLLNAVTLGGYSTYQVGVSMWQGYKEFGLIGAINTLNPFYAIAKGALDTYQAADRGDYRAAGSHGAVTAVVAVTTFSGIIQGLRALAGRPPPTTVGAGGAAEKEVAAAAGPPSAAKEIGISRSKSPDALKHLEETGQAGRELTIDRAGTAVRRRANMEGVKTRSGLDRDESPPAVFKESQGASVRHIAAPDNRSAGAQIGRQIRGLPNGTRIIIKGID